MQFAPILNGSSIQILMDWLWKLLKQNDKKIILYTIVEHYKREFWASSKIGRFTIETDLVAASVKELQGRVDQLVTHQRTLVAEKAQLQVQVNVLQKRWYRKKQSQEMF